MERFAGLNFLGFNLSEEILLCYLGQKCLLFSVINERRLYSWKTFCGTLENHEKHESLA